MGEIQEIMRQFEHGNGEWKLFLNSIKIENIHGWAGQELVFKFPVVAIVGENGIGKSTYLKASVCAYKNKAGKDFYPANMFLKTQWDADGLAGATITYKIREGDNVRGLRWRKTNDWGFSPKKRKPERNVYFLDISRTLPLDATAGYAKIAKMASKEAGENTELDDASLQALSYVLGQNYSRARFTATDINSGREVGLLTKGDGEISQFHQGAGEDAMLDMFKLLQSIPPYSLLVIDEVENSLHPQAQRRFIKHLLKLARSKKLQVILSTHSPFVLEELPAVARVMLTRLLDRKEILYNVSPEFALSSIDDIAHPELYVYLEDDEAVSLFWEILKQAPDKYHEYCAKIMACPVGNCNVVATLGDLGKRNKLPNKSIAIIDGDKKKDFPLCFALPGDMAPERQILTDLKAIDWAQLDSRFGIGAGTLFKILDDAILLPEHHEWTTYIGDRLRKSSASIWSILIEEWCARCLTEEYKASFFKTIEDALNGIKNVK